MRILAGASGFSYKAWKGAFYPDDIKPGDMLAYYADRLPAVEINNTFYRLPKADVLQTWASQTPPGFRFAIKASRRITHLKRLKDAGDETAYLLTTVRTLGDRLGCVLVQLPPNLKKDVDRLEAFLSLTAEAPAPLVFEFRHDTWADDEVHDLLRAHDAALCITDADDADPPTPVRTSAFGYLRLRREAYTSDDLRAWIDRISASGWEEAMVFFKHEDAGMGPKLAAALLDLAGPAAR